MDYRKKLKEEYKKKKFEMGVFQIRNTVTGRLLIDNSVDMHSKWNRHLAELKLGSHQNKSLLGDWMEYGEDNFAFEVVSVLKKSDREDVNYRKELKLLQELVTEEMDSGDFY